ncbi:MAG: endonuclease V [Euryarchaeota archaeon]|nr:endonuclease V [Euryarchaeota archaeon]
MRGQGADSPCNIADSLKQLQSQIASEVIVEDRFAPLLRIGGVDCSYLDERIICAVVVLDYETLEPLEHVHATREVSFPYIPTFFSFREGAAIIEAFRKLEVRPDLLMLDGCGIDHPRRAGLASHIGVLLDIPTIGVAKNILCGTADVPHRPGETSPLVYQGEQRGWLLKTTGPSRPIVISPGHRVSLQSVIDIVEHCLLGHKLPEPTRCAHTYVNELKRMKKGVLNER